MKFFISCVHLELHPEAPAHRSIATNLYLAIKKVDFEYALFLCPGQPSSTKPCQDRKLFSVVDPHRVSMGLFWARECIIMTLCQHLSSAVELKRDPRKGYFTLNFPAKETT